MVFFVGWSIKGPTSDEVGMQGAGVRGFFCRLEHQGPTSDEVGMQELR